jgi:lysophospholipase L1-like esterase
LSDAPLSRKPTGDPRSTDAHEALVRALPRRRRALLALSAACVGFAASFAPVEALLRAHERRLRQRSEAPLEALSILAPNPSGSYRLKPGVDLTTRVQDRAVRIQTNSHGMRWRETSLAKPAGKQRVAFLGDSFTFGCWSSSIESSFVSVFERGISPRKFEVLNFGVGGYGLDDMRLQLEEQVLPFAPDYVVVMIFNGNDFRDTYLGISKAKIVNGTAQFDPETLSRKLPEEFLRSDFVVSRPAPEKGAVKSWLARFATYRLLAPLLGTENLALEFRPSRRFTSYTFWSRFPYPDVAQRAVDQTLATLAEMQDSLGRRGVRLAVAAIPTRDQVYSERDSGVDFDVALPQAYLRTFARARRIPFLDLLPPLRDFARSRNRRLYVERDLHFNDAGHEVSGRALAEWFRCCVKLEPQADGHEFAAERSPAP